MTEGFLSNQYIKLMLKSKGLIANFRELPYNPKLKERAREMRNNRYPSDHMPVFAEIRIK